MLNFSLMFIGYVSFYCITVQIMQFPVLDFELDQYDSESFQYTYMQVYIRRAQNHTVQRETFEGENFSKLVKSRFSQRKLSRIAHFCSAKGRHTPNFTEKTFTYNHKTTKFAKVFSLKSFPLYGMVLSPSNIHLWYNVCANMYTCKTFCHLRYNT